MTFGQRVLHMSQQIILDNIFIIILIVALSLFIMDYYHRFLRVVKDTDHVDLVERYVWLQLIRRHRNGTRV